MPKEYRACRRRRQHTGAGTGSSYRAPRAQAPGHTVDGESRAKGRRATRSSGQLRGRVVLVPPGLLACARPAGGPGPMSRQDRPYSGRESPLPQGHGEGRHERQAGGTDQRCTMKWWGRTSGDPYMLVGPLVDQASRELSHGDLGRIIGPCGVDRPRGLGRIHVA